MTTENECVVDGVRYVARSQPVGGCIGCAAAQNSRLCNKLDSCSGIIWLHADTVDPRQEFEDKAYGHYLQRKAAGELDPTAEGDGSREALFWKQPDGSYGVLMFNAAWQGFKWGRGLE